LRLTARGMVDLRDSDIEFCSAFCNTMGGVMELGR
jgi:hypothetical protein